MKYFNRSLAYIFTLLMFLLQPAKAAASDCNAGYFAPVGWSADSIYAALAISGVSTTGESSEQAFARLYIIDTTKNELMMKYEISACDKAGKCSASPADFSPGAAADLLEKLLRQSADTLKAYTISTGAISFEPLSCNGVKTMPDQHGTRIISVTANGRPDTKELYISISSGSLSPVVFGDGGAIKLTSLTTDIAKTNIDTEFLETVPPQKSKPVPVAEKKKPAPEQKPEKKEAVPEKKAEENFETLFSTPANKQETGKKPLIAPAGAPAGGNCPEDMGFVPAGQFLMGCSRGDDECRSDEIPPANITITKGFCIDKYEVSQGAFKELTKSNPSINTACGTDCPVESVSWKLAAEYCKLAGKRLPTEAEWEYAARGGAQDRYYWGPLRDMARLHAWFWEEGAENGIHPSGEKEPNSYGLYDVTGNVWEWVSDCYSGGWYADIPAQDPVNQQDRCEERVMRGGSWINGDPTNLRVSSRNHEKPDAKAKYIGFRCVAKPME